MGRRSRNEKKMIYNGSYDDEETAALASDTLARKLLNKGEQGHKLNFPDEHTEVHPAKKIQTSEHIGVSYTKSKWCVGRWSKNEKKMVSNGYYDNEEIAGHASDTLARKLMENGEQEHKLNFPGDHTEMHPETTFTSEYIGVSYINLKWRVARWSKNEKKKIYYGWYDNKETAAHASEPLTRKLMENGEQSHKLNFPDDHTEVHPEEKIQTSEYIGVTYRDLKWRVRRWSKNEKKNFFNGSYDNEKTAAHASDTLARKLMTKGEKGHKLNFPDDHFEVHAEEKIQTSEYIGVRYKLSKWLAQRWSKNEKKMVHYGSYDNEETAAHASDTLARKLMTKGEQGHKLNFPDVHIEMHPEKFQKKKRKRHDNFQDN